MKDETKKEIFSWVRFLVIVFVISLFINKCVIVNAEVPTSSMENLIKPGDRLIGNRLAYITKNPKRLDVVIFKYPVDEDTNFIKRIIGLPGETVRISDGKIYINDSEEPLEETYLKEEWTVENDGYEFHVPENCYLMLGDNRNVSLDARYWADEALGNGKASTQEEAENFQYVSKDKILGKAEFKYWYPFKWLNKTN
ncbi:MAG: signal peptidase I [Lachnospiraceae bacterium]